MYIYKVLAIFFVSLSFFLQSHTVTGFEDDKEIDKEMTKRFFLCHLTFICKFIISSASIILT